MEQLSTQAVPHAGVSIPFPDRGMRLADPTARSTLVTPERPLAQVPAALCWLTFLLTLCYGHVPFAVWGRWGGVHKPTI